jgi:hypothetical protein
VVAAYKKQEQRRERLASTEDGYTAPGNTVADRLSYADYGTHDARGPAIRALESSGSNLKKLTRKVSGKFKKSAVDSDESARPSLQERHNHKRQQSLGLSLDSFVDVKPAEISAIPSAKNGARWPSEDTPSKNTEGSTGVKLWKLMKRISTGGLKEKYHESSSPPPVPALPKDVKQLSQSLSSRQKPTRVHSEPTSPDDMKPAHHTAFRSSFSDSPRVSAPFRANSGPPLPDPSSLRLSTTGQRPTPVPPPLQGRPSTTTRSSSPNSSEVASSRFWSRTRSTWSSVSSFGEELPPIPKTIPIGQHIIPPSELYRLEREREELEATTALESPTKSTKSTKSAKQSDPSPFDAHDKSDEYVRPSLPIPPRRHRNTPSSASPTVTSFSDDGPSAPLGADAVLSSSPPAMAMGLAEFGIVVTPPRSARRGSISQPGGSAERERGVDFGTFGSRAVNRMSEASASSSASTIGKAAPSGESSVARPPLRFREMGSRKEGAAWTEKEKAERWDDLLEMSSKAGGTIHLGGGGGLLSDSVRLSAYSDLKPL